MAQGNSRVGIWCVLMAATLWGTSGTSQAFAPAGFDPLVTGTLRLALGSATMLLIVLLTAGLPGLLVPGEPLSPTALVGISPVFSGLAVLSLAGRATPQSVAEFKG